MLSMVCCPSSKETLLAHSKSKPSAIHTLKQFTEPRRIFLKFAERTEFHLYIQLNEEREISTSIMRLSLLTVGLLACITAVAAWSKEGECAALILPYLLLILQQLTSPNTRSRNLPSARRSRTLRRTRRYFLRLPRNHHLSISRRHQ